VSDNAIFNATRPATQGVRLDISFGNLAELDNVIYIDRLRRNACATGRIGRRRLPPTAADSSRVVELWAGIWESDPRQPGEPLLRAVGASVTPFPSRPPLSPADYAEAEQQFRADLRSRSISIRRLQYGLRPDGSWPRADATNKTGRSGKGDAQYVFDRDGWPRWTIINYTDGRGFRSSCYNKKDLTPEQSALREEAVELNRQRLKEANERQLARWEKIAERCRWRWERAREADPQHPYLVRKAVKPYGLRQEGENLLVPMYGADGLIWCLQTIPPQPGAKKLNTKGGRAGFGTYTIEGNSSIVYVAEGFATGASVAEMTGCAVMVAFDSGKLRLGVERAQRRWPNARIVLAADDDWKTEGNPGLTKAVEAAEGVRGFVAVPDFSGVQRGDKSTDWNDLRALRGDDDAVRRMLADAKAPERIDLGEAEDRAPQYSQEALALAFAAEHKDDLRYVARWGKWLQWDGNYWRSDETLSIISLVRKPCRAMAARIRTQSLARQVASIKYVSAVEQLARSDRRLSATIDLWDADPMLLGTPGGTVDLKTGVLREARREDWVTKVTAVAPADKAECPIFLAFLNRVTAADSELIAYLQRAAGYVLTGITKEHSIFFNYGTGRNGKGTFTECHRRHP
jgi:phage/plasmid primase-like uncharacterized protein